MTLLENASSIDALTELGHLLKRNHYEFTAVTPETYRRHNLRVREPRAQNPMDVLRDVFGWNRPVPRTEVPPNYVSLLERAGALRDAGDELISTVRYSTLGGHLFMHSGYPTLDDASIFFGPDSYRFAAFVERELALEAPQRACSIVDIGCGTGVGGIIAGTLVADANVVLADINPHALEYAKVNVNLAAFDRAEFRESDVFSNLQGMFDLIIANPPYMVDPRARVYRDGGTQHGAALSLRILKESLQRLRSGGRVLLYTGSAVISGRDIFLEQAKEILAGAGLRFRYAEIDPDVFGEELDEPAYGGVDRIAAVALVVYAKTSD